MDNEFAYVIWVKRFDVLNKRYWDVELDNHRIYKTIKSAMEAANSKADKYPENDYYVKRINLEHGCVPIYSIFGESAFSL